MAFEFSKHSLEQMEIRNISKEIVNFIIENPDMIIEEDELQQIYQKIIDQYLYRIFVSTDKNPMKIKTVYRTSKISKYI